MAIATRYFAVKSDNFISKFVTRTLRDALFSYDLPLDDNLREAVVDLRKSSNFVTLDMSLKHESPFLFQIFHIWQQENNDLQYQERTLEEGMEQLERILRGSTFNRSFYTSPDKDSYKKISFCAIESVAKADSWVALGKNGYAGLVPAKAQIGDMIIRLYQGYINIVLRPEEEGFFNIGEASSHYFWSNGPRCEELPEQ